MLREYFADRIERKRRVGKTPSMEEQSQSPGSGRWGAELWVTGEVAALWLGVHREVCARGFPSAPAQFPSPSTSPHSCVGQEGSSWRSLGGLTSGALDRVDQLGKYGHRRGGER